MVGVGEGAQVVHAVEVGAGCLQSAGRGAGGEQEAVVVDRFAVAKHDGVSIGLERDGGGVRAQLDVLVGVEPLVVDVDLVAVGVAAQVVLGQRGPCIGS